MDQYEKGAVLGQGTFGAVYKAVHKPTGRVVAIKKIAGGGAGGDKGVDMTALREIKLLKELRSPYIVGLLDVFPHKRKLTMVLEYMDSDLEALIKAKGVVLSAANVKAYVQLLLKALAHCHARWVVHRDVKPNNMLIDGEGARGGERAMLRLRCTLCVCMCTSVDEAARVACARACAALGCAAASVFSLAHYTHTTTTHTR